ncbi:hypothetical protein D3C80_2198640 [compost metagenome]
MAGILLIHWCVVETEDVLPQMYVYATLFLVLDIQEEIAVILFAIADTSKLCSQLRLHPLI